MINVIPAMCNKYINILHRYDLEAGFLCHFRRQSAVLGFEQFKLKILDTDKTKIRSAGNGRNNFLLFSE